MELETALIKSEAELKQFLQTYKDCYWWTTPKNFPCIIVVVADGGRYSEGDDSTPILSIRTFELDSDEISKMFHYQQIKEIIESSNKEELAVYLVDSDEAIRNMASEKYNRLGQSIDK